MTRRWSYTTTLPLDKNLNEMFKKANYCSQEKLNSKCVIKNTQYIVQAQENTGFIHYFLTG